MIIHHITRFLTRQLFGTIASIIQCYFEYQSSGCVMYFDLKKAFDCVSHDKFLLVCAWEDQSENQYYMCHKASSVLYGKYSTVVKKYSTVI